MRSLWIAEQLDIVEYTLAGVLSCFVDLPPDPFEERIQETLTFYTFPDSHWIKLRTNNPLQRLMKEIRRRTKVVGAFPDGKSCLNLAAARLRHVAGTEWSTRRYMNMQPLHEMKLQPNGTAVA